MNSKYNLMLCELYNPVIHGIDEDSDPNIESHYLVFERYRPFSEGYFENLDNDEPEDEEEEDDILTDMQHDIQFLKEIYSVSIQHRSPIRNYSYIVSRPNYIQHEIGEFIILPTQEAIAILKTFWFRIIQKKWKKIFQERKRIISRRHNPTSLYFRQIYGKWSSNCDYLPGLKGMFYNYIVMEE